jgi:hypothetical protein
MSKSDLVDLELQKTAETDSAFRVHDGKIFVWLPKSQCEDNNDGTFTLPEWLAKEKELI